MGMWTVYLGQENGGGADFTIPRIEELGQIFGLELDGRNAN